MSTSSCWARRRRMFRSAPTRSRRSAAIGDCRPEKSSASPHGRPRRRRPSRASPRVPMPRRSWSRARPRSTPTRTAPNCPWKSPAGPRFISAPSTSRGPPSIRRRSCATFSTIRTGELYSERILDDYVRRLLASGYFASAQASIVPDPAHADEAPVTLAVIEAPAKRLEFGVGYSTDTQWKASGNYSDVNIDDHGLQFYADARIETKLSSGTRALRPAAGARRMGRRVHGEPRAHRHRKPRYANGGHRVPPAVHRRD